MGDFKGALDIFQEMISIGLCLDTITFRYMVSGLCSKEELQESVTKLVNLQKSVVSPQHIVVQFMFKMSK